MATKTENFKKSVAWLDKNRKQLEGKQNMNKITLSNTQKAALKKAMKADQQQFFVDALTPTRRYEFSMDHTLRVVEMILNSPATRKHLTS